MVNDEHAKLIKQAKSAIEMSDGQGKQINHVSAVISPEEIAIAIARRDSEEPRHTTSEVLKRLQS